MEHSTQVVIRKAHRTSDYAFLYSTWRNALWFAEKRNGEYPDTPFKRGTSDMITQTLGSPGIEARMACLSDDPDMLLGWAVLRGHHLEFVYVKIDYRRKGIGCLLTQSFKTFSEPKTRIGRSLAKKLTQEKPHGRKEESKVESA